MPTKKAVVKREPRTTKERVAIAKKIQDPTRSMTSIVEEVYNPSSKSSATSIAHTLLTKIDMSSWLDKAGLTDEVLAQNTARIALTAKKQNQFTGEIEDDNRIQLDGMKFAAQLKGLTDVARGEINNNTQNNYLSMTDEQLRNILERGGSEGGPRAPEALLP